MALGLSYKSRRKIDEERNFAIINCTIDPSAEYNQESLLASFNKINKDLLSVPMKQTWYDLWRILEMFSHKKRDVPVPNQAKFKKCNKKIIESKNQSSVQIDENFHNEIKYPKVFKRPKEYIKYIPKDKKEKFLSDDDRLLDLEFKIIRQVYCRNWASQILPILNKDVGMYFKNLFQNSNRLIEIEIEKTNESDNCEYSDDNEYNKKTVNRQKSFSLRDDYTPITIEGRDEEGEFWDNILQFFNDPYRFSPPMRYLNRPCRKQDYKNRHILWAF